MGSAPTIQSMANGTEQHTGHVILLPVYDDWAALSLLLGRLAAALGVTGQ